ncbi:MAG: GIY-YIG nuclease family protein [Verrucomicrobiota bacterium]
MPSHLSQDEGCPPKCRSEDADVGGPSPQPKFWYVYILRSDSFPKETYVGVSLNPKARLAKHNRGENRSTARYRPWRVLSITGFPSQIKAEAFERYLKSGSGRAFRKKHFE